MIFFKYYRPNVFFEKSIRYNELYFSENIELNDPYDLKVKYYFEDNINSWKVALSSPPLSPTWSLENYIDIKNQHLIEKLNQIFLGTEIDSEGESIKDIVKSKSKQLEDIFSSVILEDPPKTKNRLPINDRAQIISFCSTILTELLARSMSYRFYSVSFSKLPLSPMMWAHYAEGFKGCVVIYRASSEGEIDLFDHPQASESKPAKFKEIEYLDQKKSIPILECIAHGEKISTPFFFKKNAFWSYENEFRLLIKEKIDTRLLTISNVKKNYRGRIFHHDPCAVAGVIFGPRSSLEFRKKTEHILRDNRFFRNKEPFFSLETELTHDGDIVVSSGYSCICIDRSELKRVHQGEDLERVLVELNIR
ncbi:DUF2971 domain-containing protein [Achromobacter xylosoxidans]